MVKARSINFFRYACLICLALAGATANPGMTFGFGLTFNTTINQPKTVSGVVTDAQSGETLPGVNVIVKGTSTGTSTNADGNYKLGVPTLSDTLIFSFVGFETKQVPISGQTELNVALQTQTVSGEEVVVVGYGTQEKSDLTGSVASVSQERLEQVPNNNFYQALQGSVPGLLVSQNSSGAEQNNQSLLIRGRTSIEASNSPLIVLDGVPYNGSISEINPADIESINVLKDASAAAIYGSRGANGVVLITTKKGQGQAKIAYEGSFGVQRIANLPHLLNGQEFYDFKTTREPGSITPSEEEIYQNNAGVDWVGLATQAGQRQDHTLSVSGGSERVNYYVSGSVLAVQGIAVNDDFNRFGSRVNVESSVTDWFTLATNTQLTFTDGSGLDADFGGESGAFYMNPLTRAYNEDGSLAIYPWEEDPFFQNPLDNTLAQNKDHTYSVVSNNYAIVDFPFLEGLEYKLNTGIEYVNNDDATYLGRNTQTGLEFRGDADVGNSISNNYLIENILSFDRDFGKHSLFLTGLYSYQLTKYNSIGIDGQGFISDALTTYQFDQADLINPGTGFSRDALISQMLRVNYGYDSRYLLTLTGRRDGYSGFGSNTKYSFFPSAAFGWTVSNEDFFNSETVNNLKIRLSYGRNGNQAVGPFQTLARLSSRLYIYGPDTAPGYVVSQLSNPVLGWEATTTLNLGLDFGFWNDRLQGSVDVYNADTDDLLLDRTIPSIQGISSITQNIGATNNKGIDLALTSYNIRDEDFSWNTSVTMSANKNKIVSLVGDEDIVNDRLFIDEPIRVNYDYVYDGVWQENDDILNSAQPNAQPGFVKIEDINNDGEITADGDRVIQGQRDPKFIWGLQNTISYKNFSLYFFFQGVHGSERFQPLSRDNVYSEVRRNTIKHNWWTPENPTNEHWANHIDANVLGLQKLESDAFVRLKDISLSYNFADDLLQKIGVRNLKLYTTARNLITITNWSGLDPELSSQRSIPLTKEFVFGINLSL